MITITFVETRPNLNVDFYRVPGGYIDYIQKYNDIRHRAVYEWSLADDLLSRTFVVNYDSQEGYDAFLNVFYTNCTTTEFADDFNSSLV